MYSITRQSLAPLIHLCLLATAADGLAATGLYLAPNGSDANPGTEAKPFATLERARDEVRKLKKAGGLPKGGVVIELSAGLYTLEQSFELTAEDAGSAKAPIVYRARPGDNVRLSGGRTVTNWKPVIEPAVLQRLDPAARGHVLQADVRVLRSIGFGDSGKGPGMEVFFNDAPMTLARYPNDGFIKIAGVEGPTEVDVRGTKGCVEGIFTYDSERPARWVDEVGGMVFGYWFWDWAESRHRIDAIDAAAKRMTLATPPHSYGYRKGQWFYGYNLLCELDQPGEWKLDRQSGTLYFWPPSPVAQGLVTVSLLNTLVAMDGAGYVTLRGMTFEAARDTAVKIDHAAYNRVVGCTLRNLGGGAVSINGTQSGVSGCDISATGNGGITLTGGDRKTLTPAGLFADNNHIHHWSRWNRMGQPGISTTGVGNRVAHNLLDNAPHMAIFFGGNDHVIEFNEIHSVCYESNDAGAIYGGRDWTMRGTVIRCNYLHHLSGYEGKGCVGVYLDDMYSGTLIHGNVFNDVTSAAFVGGGHDNVIANNIFVNCKPAVHVDARALGWAHQGAEDWLKEGLEKGTLAGTVFNKPPYSKRYPKLVDILKQDSAAPTGTLVERNICQGGKWDNIEGKARPFVTLAKNMLDGDPRFVDAPNGNFQLRDDSPALALGFKRIPSEKIGLQQSADRASWPVTHRVRPPGQAAANPSAGR